MSATSGRDTLGTGLGPDLARSWLLVNAADRQAYRAAETSAADQLVLDVEDAVDPRRKPQAREIATEWLQEHPAWVRVNAHGTEHWEDDVRALAGCTGLLGVVLAKTESRAEAEETAAAFGVPVVALLESALGVERAVDVGAAQGVVRLAFGSGDYRRDTGTAATELALAYPRSRLVVASRVSGLPGPVDGPSVSDEPVVVAEQSLAALELGMTARLCIRPGQAAVVNETMSPSAADLRWAAEVIAEFESRDGMIRDGSDLPRLARARQLTERAAALARGTTSP